MRSVGVCPKSLGCKPELEMTQAACFPRYLMYLLALPMILAAGCTHGSRKGPTTTQPQVSQLTRDVEFLSQPSLKGRKCRSMESWTVRHYVRQGFQQARLRPWGKSHSFDQPFTLGTNVVGVMPGNDKNLADQVILVCTHYDGPGVVGGKVLPAAADSASSTAVLLEVARQLAANKHPLRRTVAFAAFDCGAERYLGAFAFTCRKDFDPARISAVIDLDMLGRPLFDVVDDTLAAIGATDSATLGSAVERATWPGSESRRLHRRVTLAGLTAAGRHAAVQSPDTRPALRVLPAGLDLAGPIADYFAFQQWPIPCLLLTNGLYFDYYKPSDTADKIDYRLLEQTASLTARMVRELASRDIIAGSAESPEPDRKELQAIRTVLDEIRAQAAANDLTPGEIQMLQHLSDQAGQLLAKATYTRQDRNRFIATLLSQGTPSVIRFLYDRPKPDPQKVIGPQQVAVLMRLQRFFAEHSAFASRSMQQVVRYFTEGWSFFHLLGGFNHSACDIRNDDIAYELQGADCRLSFFYPHLTIQAGLGARKMDVAWSIVDFRGSAAETIDFCLLTWSSAQGDCLDAVMPEVLGRVTGQNPGPRYQDWFDWRLTDAGIRNEAEWFAGLWQTDNPLLLKAVLARAAGGKHVGMPTDRLLQIIADPGMRADVRADAIQALPTDTSSRAELALVNLLEDRTPTFELKQLPAFDPSYPFFNNTIVELARRFPEPHERMTLGQVAHRKLVAMTGRDLGTNAEPWRVQIGSRSAGGTHLSP